MRAMRNSPEFANRQRILEQHDAKEAEEAHVPELIEDDLGEHILPDDLLDEDHPAALVQCLMSYGVSRYNATCAIARMTPRKMTPCTFHEVYGRGEIVRAANDSRRNLNIKRTACI